MQEVLNIASFFLT